MTTWPDKMITQAEAFAKAASWPVYARCVIGFPGGPKDSDGNLAHGQPNAHEFIAGDINLFCGRCDQSTGQLRRADTTYNGSLDEMLSMVLRHMVMAHDVPLNTRPRPDAQDNGPSDGST